MCDRRRLLESTGRIKSREGLLQLLQDLARRRAVCGGREDHPAIADLKLRDRCTLSFGLIDRTALKQQLRRQGQVLHCLKFELILNPNDPVARHHVLVRELPNSKQDYLRRFQISNLFHRLPCRALDR